MRSPVVAVDFDGTLIDSMPALEDLAVEVLKEMFTHPPPDYVRARYRESAGETFRRQLETIIPDASDLMRDTLAARYEERKREVLARSQPFDDVKTALSHLDEVQLWVVTSTTTDLVVQTLHWHELWHHFTGCLGPEWGVKWNKLDMIRADYFVGDTDRDAHHALMARGCRFLGVRRQPGELLSLENTTHTDLRQIARMIK